MCGEVRADTCVSRVCLKHANGEAVTSVAMQAGVLAGGARGRAGAARPRARGGAGGERQTESEEMRQIKEKQKV